MAPRNSCFGLLFLWLTLDTAEVGTGQGHSLLQFLFSRILLFFFVDGSLSPVLGLGLGLGLGLVECIHTCIDFVPAVVLLLFSFSCRALRAAQR